MILADIDKVVEQEELIFGSSLGKEMLKNEITSNKYAHYYVLEEDNIIGYIGLSCTYEVGQVNNFYIIPEYQQRKLGEKLLRFALAVFLKKKVSTVTLEVKDNNLKAIKLYQKCGFKQEHIRKKYYKDGRNAILMLKKM